MLLFSQLIVSEEGELMNVAVAGGTGFIGKHLLRLLTEQGHRVTVISRSKSNPGEGGRVVSWSDLEADPAILEGTDGIVNLAGESINQLWTKAAKKRILQSRLEASSRIALWAERSERKPLVVVNGSGMNIYGTSETAVFDEDSPAIQSDFLSEVVTRWEEAADRIPAQRLVKLRTGLVLGTDGGALPVMALPYKLGLGGKAGSGRQWVSWIHIRDMVRLIEFCLTHPEVSGPVNATAPEPVTNDGFGRILAGVLGRPHWMPVPETAMKLLFGERSILVLKGQKVLPRKLLALGFRYDYPDLKQTLHSLYRKS